MLRVVLILTLLSVREIGPAGVARADWAAAKAPAFAVLSCFAASEQVASASVEAQSQWFAELKVNRLAHATRRTAQQVKHDAELLDEVQRRLANGRHLSAAGAKKLIALADDREVETLARLAREYRMAVYEAYRQDRRQYDLRIQAYRQLETQWQALGATPRNRLALIAWLQAALDRATSGSLARLPARPTFAELKSLAQSSVAPAPQASVGLAIGSKKTTSAHAAPVELNDSANLPMQAHALNASKPRVGPSVTNSAQPGKSRIALRSTSPAGATTPEIAPEPDAIRNIKPAKPAARGAINLSELSARLRGCKQAVADFNVRLQARQDYDAMELHEFLADLETLASDRESAGLYLAIIDEDDRRHVGQLPLLATSISLLAQRIAGCRQRTTQPDELARLDLISRRLAELAVLHVAPAQTTR